MTAPAPGFEDLRPVPRLAFAARIPLSGAVSAPRLMFFCDSAVSFACRRSYQTEKCQRSKHWGVVETVVTFLSKPSPLVGLKVLLRATLKQRSIAFGLCEVECHGLFEKLKSLDLLDGFLRSIHSVEDNESLAFSLQICFCDDINDRPILGEYF